MNKEKFKAFFALFIATFFWGSAYIFVKQLLNNVSPYMILALRFFFAAIILIIIYNKRLLKINLKTLKAGIIMGIFLLMLFSIKLGWLPANGDAEGGLILPVITLMLYPMAYITRLTRSSMLDVLGQDYIRTAKAKGVSNRDIILKHALKNSLIPVITYFGPMLAYIVTGSLVVEKIFAVPGIGRAFVNSITGRDYPLIMGTTIILAALIVIMNLVSDILYKIADPRITLE